MAKKKGTSSFFFELEVERLRWTGRVERVPFQSKVMILCGKGGVGKTTLSLALAMRVAKSGRRVLVVSSHPLAELAVAVSLDGLSAHSPKAAANLFLVHIDAKQLLAEVVEQNFPVDWVAKAVLNSTIYQNLIEVAPGLKEFYFLARLQALSERRTDGGVAYDVLLWDAPATGHFLSTLGSAKNFETFLTGPLAVAGAELHRFFSNIENVRLLPVTTLEEMAIEEMLEMCATLESGYRLKSAAVVLNMISPLALATDEAARQLIEECGETSDPALRFAIERGTLERARVAEVHGRLRGPVIGVERIRHFRDDIDLLVQVGQPLEGIAAWA
ncbi:MAG: ArsA family ATPase [Bryobacteraceae bacterium]